MSQRKHNTIFFLGLESLPFEPGSGTYDTLFFGGNGRMATLVPATEAQRQPAIEAQSAERPPCN